MSDEKKKSKLTVALIDVLSQVKADVNFAEEVVKEKAKALIAKKDFVISHNEYVKKIKAGDDISDVPVLYHENLRTEGVL